MTTPSSPKPLLSTADYDLVVTTDKDDMSAYGLLNRETGVMEAIGPHLPSAMMSLYQLQEGVAGSGSQGPGGCRTRRAAEA